MDAGRKQSGAKENAAPRLGCSRVSRHLNNIASLNMSDRTCAAAAGDAGSTVTVTLWSAPIDLPPGKRDAQKNGSLSAEMCNVQCGD